MLMRKTFSITLGAVAVGLALTACATSGNPSATASATSKMAASITDCGGGNNHDSYSVQVQNRSSQRILLETTEVDCYDWYGQANPTRFNVDLSAGTKTSSENLYFNEIAELSGSIRPWNWHVSVSDPEDGFVIAGRPETRPVIKWAQQRCNTGAGMTACDGASLCTDDPAGEKVSTKVPLRNMVNGEESSLTMTTYCSVTDQSAKIIFTD